MKKVINNMVYNTDTAEELAEYTNGLGGNDIKYVREVLYRTKKGRFFLYGEGGPASAYSDGNGRSMWGICTIIPLTDKEALNWLVKRDEVNLIEQLFENALEEA